MVVLVTTKKFAGSPPCPPACPVCGYSKTWHSCLARYIEKGKIEKGYDEADNREDKEADNREDEEAEEEEEAHNSEEWQVLNDYVVPAGKEPVEVLITTKKFAGQYGMLVGQEVAKKVYEKNFRSNGQNMMFWPVNQIV